MLRQHGKEIILWLFFYSSRLPVSPSLFVFLLPRMSAIIVDIIIIIVILNFPFRPQKGIIFHCIHADAILLPDGYGQAISRPIVLPFKSSEAKAEAYQHQVKI